jgi:Uma2 family endonuclease
MAMPTLHRLWTAAEVAALPDDDDRHECLNGEHVVTPPPAWIHQSVVEWLHLRLAPYVDAHQLGYTKFSPAEVVFGPRQLVQPDLFVVRWVDGPRPRAWRDITGLLLAVEVLSPRTASRDRGVKREIYQAAGVGEYWIVDTQKRMVERWRPTDTAPERRREQLVWQPRADVAALSLDLTALFAHALDD